MSQQRLTLGAVIASDLPRRVNLCAEAGHVQREKFIQLLNDTIERILYHGSFEGTECIVRLCLSDGCITLPRSVASLGAVRSCESVPINGMWGPFLPFSGSFDGCESLRFTELGQVPTFREECNPGIIRTWLQNGGDAGKTMLYQGQDSDRKWVRKFVGGQWINGEQVVLADPFVDTATSFRTITGVQKDQTIDRVLVYKMLPGGPVQIAIYEYDETAPSYQRFRISPYRSLGPNVGCSSSSCDAATKTVEALVKLAYAPVARDSDFLAIGNLGALRLGMQAMKAEQDRDYAAADLLWFGNRKNQRIGCIPLLNQELRTVHGDRVDVRSTPMGSARLSRVMGGFI